MTTLRLALGAALLLSAINSAHADCTREEAFNKMMALNPVTGRMQQDWAETLQKNPAAANAKVEKIKAFSGRLGEASTLLAQEKYGAACVIYDALAKEAGVSLENSGTLTMKQLETDGGRGTNGACDLTEAAKRSNALAASFHKQYPPGKATDAQSRDFSKRMSDIGIEMSSNPSKACALIDDATKQYGLK